ncbi:DUF2207 domain-containing protein [Cohnella terricola]|uniref:DUF2207 domain-containing protein n=1 Tax=Cohnella terricola TaxID=1289167 RepID=A0A559JIU6_9BACL|nr:DUF2207 domain-containing protein [Cohnella terricola]TVX99791.1 DUF2207 domain-containing protein [Cohnella terricola]
MEAVRRPFVLLFFVGLICSSSLTFSAIPVFAKERSFEISEVGINARIDAEGNMWVTEQDTYRFDGSFNGIVVQLDTSGSDGIDNFQAFEVTSQQEIPLVVEAASGKGKKIKYKVYHQAHDETNVFRFTYEVKNAVQVYADTAELYWKFFDSTNPSTLGAVQIDIKLPDGEAIPKEDIKAFGHGPLSGTVEIAGDGTVQYRVSPLPPEQNLEVRILFPASFVPNSLKVNHSPMLEKIMQEELKWANDSDNSRDASAHPWGSTLVYAIILLAANVAAAVILYFRFGREQKPDWNEKYYRELPGDVTPAVASYLMDYKIEPRDLMATLVDLVRKKYVDMQAVTKEGGLFHRDQKDYSFRLINELTDGLKPHEELVIDWLFRQLGHNGEVSLFEIRQYAGKKANAGKFLARWSEWQGKVVQEARQLGYFDTSKAGSRIALAAAIVQIAGFLIFAPDDVKWLLVCAAPLFLCGMKIKRRTKFGATERSKWKAFKRFLHDYSQIASREPLAVHLWEHYFVYAISLGEAKRMIAISRINLPQTGSEHYTVYSTVTHGDFGRHYDHFADSFNKTVSTARSHAPSSRGSGGGFSSGGGGGGGGGGRGAF